MAILNGIIRKMNGSAGSLTFKQTHGQTIVSEKITNPTDAKTPGQLKQRMKWSNIIKMYQVLQPYMKQAFGGGRDSRSDYNLFVQTNLGLNPVYLTKQQVTAGACIVAPYAVTQGTLKSITVTGKGKEAVTNISVGSLTINEETTVAEFSNAVVQNNSHINYDDQLTYFLVHQDMNEVTSTPIAEVDACYIVLDKSNNAKLYSLVYPRGFCVKDGYLAAKPDMEYGNHGMVWVLSRKKEGKTIVSTQYLICENDILENFQGRAAYDLAVTSYGGAKEAYLTPGGVIEPEFSETTDKPQDNGTPGQGTSNPPAGDQTGNNTNTGSGTVTPPSGGDDDDMGD